MEEKELVRSVITFNEQKFKKIIMNTSIPLAILPALVWFTILAMDDAIYYFFSIGDGETLACIGAGIGIIIVFNLIRIFVSKLYSSVELVVTDKRIYGCASFGKQVDLPLDSISAVALYGNKGICVATSSGKINFGGIQNREDVYNTISNLLLIRQEKGHTVINQKDAISNVDELKKYKELLDTGVITQDEFDAKKKQLLGL